MILLVHMLFGAAIGSLIKNVYLAIILAFLSHYFLDLFPHVEYLIKNKGEKPLHDVLPDIFKVFLDFCIGLLIISLFSLNQPIIYIYAFFAVIPDTLTVLNYFLPSKILNIHDKLHTKIHFLKNKKISNFWRILSQIMAVIISIILLKN